MAEPENTPSPLSEVGCALPQDSESAIAALEAQNRALLDLVKSIYTPRVLLAEVKSNSITLPKFDPDSAGADASAWCNTVTLIFNENMLQGSSLVMALSKAMQGSASQWLAQICFSGMTWPQFQELFVQRFVGVETLAATLTNIFNGENLPEYGSRLVTSLMSKFKSIELEELIVSIVLTHLSNLDARLLKSMLTGAVKNRNDLQQQLKAHAYSKRNESFGNEVERKKMKLPSLVKCHHCGRLGHKIADCHKRRTDVRQRTTSTSGQQQQRAVYNRTCYKCGELGHYAPECPRNRHNLKEVEINKRVNLVAIEPKGILKQFGTFFRLLILSGFCNISRCCGDRESGWWFQLRQSTRLHLQVPFLYHRLLDGFPVEPRIHCVPELRNVCLWILCWHLSENGRCQCESPPKIDPEVHGLLQIRRSSLCTRSSPSSRQSPPATPGCLSRGR
nr:uncharacterized protein LOC121502714 [Drosophila kikkawai]